MITLAQPADLTRLGVDVTHHFVADEVYLKRSVIRAGAVLAKHTHDYDHASALVRGTVRLVVDGVAREVTGPKMLLIEAGKAHSITSVTPVIWHCIHITDETDPERIDDALVSRDSRPVGLVDVVPA